MKKEYSKVLLEKNSHYSVYHGSGIYLKAKQNTLLHYDTDLTVTYFINCSGSINIEGKHYNLASGDVVIMNPNEIHCCNVDDNTTHERISICINKSVLKNFPFESTDFFDFFENREKGLNNVIQSEIVTRFNIDALMKEILFYSQNKSDKNQIMCTCKIVELIYQIGNVPSYGSATDYSDIEENPIVSETLKYISSHYTDDIDCSKIAEKLFISKYRLEHLFKESLGISLWEYIIIKRLMLVNELIQKKYSVEEASYSAGFHNYSNFYRLYKKHFNMSPLKYKKIVNQ